MRLSSSRFFAFALFSGSIRQCFFAARPYVFESRSHSSPVICQNHRTGGESLVAREAAVRKPLRLCG